MWSSGQSVVVRNVWHGRVRHAIPVVVIEDTRERFVGWTPSGARIAVPDPRGVPIQWRLVESAWPYDAVWVHRWGESWIAQHLRPPDRADWWYVDVVDRTRRSGLFFDSRDLFLDVVTEDGLEIVDQEDLAEALRLGVLDPTEARWAERVAATVHELVRACAPPFDGEWTSWQPPDAAWPTPALPEGWDVV